MKKSYIFALAVILGPAFAWAQEGRTLKGVTLPVQVAREGKVLALNGMGLRTRIVFKVYVGGLYVEKPSKDAAALIASEQNKLMELVFLRNVDGGTVAGAISEGFEKNSKEQLPALKERVEKFRKLIPDLKKGDKLSFFYEPARGLSVESNGKASGQIEGKDFADALFRCWLGGIPADKDLKKGLLGE
ncbi:MAG: chalcone isomerase family protein [Elusimicrobiales bacterium]